jgi:hypothetical protein
VKNAFKKSLKKEIQKNKVKGSFPWTYSIDIKVKTFYGSKFHACV